MTITAIAADGTKHEFPDETDQTVIGRVMKSYAQDHPSRETTPAAQLLTSTGQGFEGFTRGLTKGVVKSVGGLLQGALDMSPSNLAQSAASTITGIPRGASDGNLISQGVNSFEDIINKMPMVDADLGTMGVPVGAPELMGRAPDPHAMSNEVGEFVGQILPFVMQPETALFSKATIPARLMAGALQGATVGAADLQDGASLGDRMLGRAEGAIGGGLLGGTIGAIGGTITKKVNESGLRQGMNTIREWLDDTDPALRGVKAKINVPLLKTQAEFEQRSVDLARHQDLLGPIPLKDEEGFLETIANKTTSLKDISEDSLNGRVRKVLEKIAPQFIEPETIASRNGITYERIGPGKYQLQGTEQVLPSAATKQLLEAAKRKRPLEASYTQIKSAVETLDEQITKSKSSDDAGMRATTLELRNTLQSKLDAWETPGLRKQTTDLTRWRERNYEPLRDAALKPVFEATDEVARANAVLKLALGDNESAAAKAAKLIGTQGREAVFRGAVKKAMNGAMDTETGQLDAARFAKFFEDKSGLKPYFDSKSEGLINGMRNLMTDSALRKGESPKVNLTHGRLARWGTGAAMLPGFGAMAMGHVGSGVAEMSAVLGAGAVFKGVEHLLNDTFGRNLLAAAAKAKPGSPRMGRISQTITQRFLTPAAGVTADDALSP